MFSWGRKKQPENAPVLEENVGDDSHASSLSSHEPNSSSEMAEISSDALVQQQDIITDNENHFVEQVEDELTATSAPLEALSENLDAPGTRQASEPMPATNWSDALYLACRSQTTFMQTPKQVLQQQEQIQRPRQDECILIFRDKSVEATAKAVVAQLEKNSKEATSSLSSQQPTLTRRVVNVVSGTASTVAWGVSKLYQYTVADADDYDDVSLDWNQDGDDNQVEAIPLVPWDQPVVCVRLMDECISQLTPHCNQLSAVTLQGTSDGDTYSFAHWAASFCPSIARNLQHQQDGWNLLAHVLVQSGHAILVDDNKYLVFGNNDALSKPTNIDYAVSLLKLNQAIDAAQVQIHKWQQQEADCTRRAIEKRQRNDLGGAKLELARKGQLDKNISTTQTSLLNLLQVRDTLELSYLQQSHITTSLKQATSALAALRQEVTVEDVDDMMLDLQEESNHVHDMTTALVGNSNQKDFDEEELMQELERLQLDDDNGGDKGKTTERTDKHATAVDTTTDVLSERDQGNDPKLQGTDSLQREQVQEVDDTGGDKPTEEQPTPTLAL